MDSDSDCRILNTQAVLNLPNQESLQTAQTAHLTIDANEPAAVEIQASGSYTVPPSTGAIVARLKTTLFVARLNAKSK